MFMQEQESSVDSLDVQVSCSNVSPVMQASPPPPPHTHTICPVFLINWVLQGQLGGPNSSCLLPLLASSSPNILLFKGLPEA